MNEFLFQYKDYDIIYCKNCGKREFMYTLSSYFLVCGEKKQSVQLRADIWFKIKRG